MNLDYSRLVCVLQSQVPLEVREHLWLVKAAAGAWPDIYSLFREDSSLLHRRDFISGFTVLHWIAKHGDHRVLNTLWYDKPCSSPESVSAQSGQVFYDLDTAMSQNFLRSYFCVTLYDDVKLPFLQVRSREGQPDL